MFATIKWNSRYSVRERVTDGNEQSRQMMKTSGGFAATLMPGHAVCMSERGNPRCRSGLAKLVKLNIGAAGYFWNHLGLRGGVPRLGLLRRLAEWFALVHNVHRQHF